MEVLRKEIEVYFGNVGKYLNKLDDRHQQLSFSKPYPGDVTTIRDDLKIEDLKEQIEGIESNISHQIFCIYIRLVTVFEINGNAMLVKITSEVYKSDDYAMIDYYNYAGVFVSPKLYKLESIFELYENLVDKNDSVTHNNYRLSLLERLLRSTGFILKNRNIIPISENDVQKEMYNQIRVVFPDTVRESTIPKITKNYRVDFSVKSLSTCIEYKFVASTMVRCRFKPFVAHDS
jgi:hypothetical protein